MHHQEGTLSQYTTVYPWLMERREDILGAKGLVENDEESPPSKTKLNVDCFDPGSLRNTEEEEWIQSVAYVKWIPLPPAPDDGRGKRLNQHIPTGDAI
jgi:hypothetical protein